jgi:hypothetical protein
MSDDEYDEFDPMNKEIIDDDYNPNRLVPVNKKMKTTWAKPASTMSMQIQMPEVIKPKIKSNFFTKTILDLYLPNISSQLTNKTIMNLDQILEYFNGPNITDYQIAIELRMAIIKENLCSDITTRYLEQVLERSIEKQTSYVDYDIAFIIDTSIQPDIRELQNIIISLIIVQRKECNKFANAYALNLICSKQCYSCGNILLGLYLYTILSHPRKTDYNQRLEELRPPEDINIPYFGPPIIHLGLLEIAGGFTKVNALCLYTKFGFVINSKLSGRYSNCFTGETNIAMIKRFKGDESIRNDDTFDNVIQDAYDIETEKSKIIRIVNKEEPGYIKHIICEFKDANVQHMLGQLYNSLTYIEKEYASLVNQSKFPINKIGTEFTPEFLEKIQPVENELQTIRSKIQKIEASPRDIKIENLNLEGGKIKNKAKKKKTIKNRQKKKSKKTKRQHKYKVHRK